MSYDPAAVRQQLGRVLASPGFAQAPRMSRFLSFVVEKKLAGRSPEIKEYTIGVEVFDRTSHYDPRTDPVVRVEARRLRQKLEAYYSAAKPGELVIEIPKGSYEPRFHATSQAPGTPLRPARKSVAVLRFASLASTPHTEHFCDGLVQELIHRLTRIENLRVVAWGTSARIVGSEGEVLDSARALGIQAVLSGSMRTAGDRLRVIAQLIATEDGTYLWSGMYDGSVSEVFAVQEEIAAAIARTLAVTLAAAPPATSSAEVYRLYLEGRSRMHGRTQSGLREAAALFERAVDLDPQFAAAHSGLADAYTLLADYTHEPPASAIPRARAAAQRALELEPRSAEALSSLALIRSLYDWRWDEARQLFETAVRIAPGYATAHHWFAADHLAMTGDLARARTEIEIAAELDPLSMIIREGVAMIALMARNYEQALAEYRKALAIDPRSFKPMAGLGRTLIQTGAYEEAIACLERAIEAVGEVPNMLAALGQANALAGRTGRARELLVRLSTLAETRHVPYTCFAIIHIGFGEYERAIEFLERACDRRDLPCAVLKMHPVYDPVRGDQRFKALLERVGFEP